MKSHAVHARLLQSCPTLCDPMDCSPPGSSVRVISWARILEWVDTPSSRGSSQPRDRTVSPTSPELAGSFFTTSATCCCCCCCCSVVSVVSDFCGLIDCNPPGSSVYGILQAILEWVAIPSSRAPSPPRDRTWVSYFTALADGFFTTSTTWEATYL